LSLMEWIGKLLVLDRTGGFVLVWKLYLATWLPLTVSTQVLMSQLYVPKSQSRVNAVSIVAASMLLGARQLRRRYRQEGTFS